MIKNRTPKEDKELQNAHEMEKYDNSMPHQPVNSDYVTVKVPFKEVKDEETGMITRNYDVTGVEEQLCQGWDVMRVKMVHLSSIATAISV